MTGVEGPTPGRNGLRGWLGVINTVLTLATAIASAVAAWFAASYTGALTELEQRRFSEVDVSSLLSKSREKVEIGFGKRSELDRYVLRINSGAREDVENLTISVRALVKDYKSGEKSEVELASMFESVLYPSDARYEWNLTQQVKSNLGIHRIEPRSREVVGFIVLAEWDSGLSQARISRLSSRKFFEAW